MELEIDKLLIFIADHIKTIEEAKGEKLKDFAELCGVNQENLTRYRKYGEQTREKERHDPHLRTFYKILKGILGRKPIDLKGAQPRIIALTEETPGWLNPDDYYAVPLVDGRIAAGTGRIVSDEIIDLVWVYKPELGNRRNLVAVKLADNADSMEPTLHPGDIVIVDRNDKEVSPKGLYAVRIDNEGCAVKRLRIHQGKIWLISDNPSYLPEIAEVESLGDLVIGRVIWSWTSWMK